MNDQANEGQAGTGTKLSPGAILVLLGALATLGSLFLPFYDLDLGVPGIDGTVEEYTAFSNDLYLFPVLPLCVFYVVGFAAFVLTAQLAELAPRARARVVTGLLVGTALSGVAALTVLTYAIRDLDDLLGLDIGVTAGAWVMFAGAVVAVVGGVLELRARADEVDTHGAGDAAHSTFTAVLMLVGGVLFGVATALRFVSLGFEGAADDLAGWDQGIRPIFLVPVLIAAVLVLRGVLRLLGRPAFGDGKAFGFVRAVLAIHVLLVVFGYLIGEPIIEISLDSEVEIGMWLMLAGAVLMVAGTVMDVVAENPPSLDPPPA